jgi:predicted lysophospholipase L1 biosynthesis ABC-type transport system permease subunit
MDTTDSLTAPMPIRRYPGRIAVLLGLVALADFLIFGQEPGINLFLFALAVCAGILLPATKELSPSKAALLLGLSLLASAPLLETPSAMGFGLCLTALMSVVLVSGKLMPRSLTGLPLAFSRFALVIPLRLAEDVGKYAASLGNWGCPIRRPTVGIATPNRQAYWLGLTRSLGVSR